VAILQSEHVKKFLFTIRPFFFLLTGQRRETRQGPSWPVRPAGEGLRPARDARGRPAGGAARPAVASQSHAQPWARLAEAAREPATATGNAGGGVLCREQGGEGERGREGSEKLGRPLWRALRYGRR